jgi:hypothetical protein
MKKNMGSIDKIIRLIFAAVIVYLFVTGLISGTLGLVLLVFSLVFVVTSLTGVCPLYTIFGINTCSIKK